MPGTLWMCWVSIRENTVAVGSTSSAASPLLLWFVLLARAA